MVKLKKMIELLHERYSQEELQNLGQYQRLMSLYESLKPLLPEGVVGDLKLEQEDGPGEEKKKRSAFNMDFMGEKGKGGLR